MQTNTKRPEAREELTLRLPPDLIRDAELAARSCNLILTDFLKELVEVGVADRRDRTPQIFYRPVKTEQLPKPAEELVAEKILEETSKLAEIKPEQADWDGELLASGKAEGTTL